MLNSDQVCERLKEIGPYVFYEHKTVAGDGNEKYHSFRIQETKSGPQKHCAMLAMMGDDPSAVMTEEALNEQIEEGKRRYAQGSKKA